MSAANNEQVPAQSGALPMSEAMSAGELRTVIDALGLSQQDVARILDVQDRSVRRWLAGTHPIPDVARVMIEAAEQATAAGADEIASACMDVPDPVMVVPRTDDELWEQRPDMRPYPARWYRHMVYRAAEDVPGLRIIHADER